MDQKRLLSKFISRKNVKLVFNNKKIALSNWKKIKNS